MHPNTLISNSIFFSFVMHPSQHAHLWYPRFFHVLFPKWLSFCSIGQNWSNRCLVKSFLLCSWNGPITKHYWSKSLIQPSHLYPIGIKRNRCLIRVSSLCISLLEYQFIYCLCTTYLKAHGFQSPTSSLKSCMHHISQFTHQYYVIGKQHSPRYLHLYISS